MEKIRTLIVDDDIDFCNMLKTYFTDDDTFEIIGQSQDGVDALEKIRDLEPDLVILDIIMPKLDGIGVLEELRQWKQQLPSIVIFSSVGQDELTRQASELGACSFFLKPFRMDVFKRRLERIMHIPKNDMEESAETHEKSAQDNIDMEITKLLHQMAIPPHIKGYRYLREAIGMVVRDVNLINQITYEIYPRVAEQFDTTSSRVERAMRHAIEVAWNRCRVETIERVFGYTVNMNKDKPSNGEFIAMIADKIRIKFRMF